MGIDYENQRQWQPEHEHRRKSILKISSEHDEMVGRVKAVLAYLDLVEQDATYVRAEDLTRLVQAMLALEGEEEKDE